MSGNDTNRATLFCFVTISRRRSPSSLTSDVATQFKPADTCHRSTSATNFSRMAAFHLNNNQPATPSPPPHRSFRYLGLALGAVVAMLAAGCAPSALSLARQKMAAGRYSEAHQELSGIQIASLTPSERREVKDDLCLSDFKIGAPAYSAAEQRRVCTDAVNEPGSQSSQYLDQINAATRQAAVDKVNDDLRHGDLADAEQAALIYVSTPGADSEVVAKWSHRMWELVNKQDRRAETRRKKAMAAAIAALRAQYPLTQKMSKDQFVQWVAKQGTVGGAPLFSSVALKDKETNLTVTTNQMHDAALKLDRLSIINDGTVARCGCDGRTNVSIAETNFPLYLVRLDPETKRSEVLILPHRQ